jgi:hypothetical protein
MVLNNKFKQFVKIIENGNGSVVANRGSVSYFIKTETMAASFHTGGKYCWDRLRLKVCLITGMKISEQPLITKLGMPSSPDTLRRS